MSRVRMRHPDLPADQTIEVDALAAPHHAGSGWVSVTDDPTAPADAQSDAGVPAPGGDTATADQDKTPQRRRAPKEGEDK